MLGLAYMLNLCIQCKQVYEAKREWQRFCSRKCSVAHYSQLNHLNQKKALAGQKELVLNLRKSNFPDLPQQVFCYGWFRDTYLYIGATTIGFTRFNNHHVMNVLERVLLDDEVHFWFTSIENLAALERHLVETLKPKYNCTNWRQTEKPLEVPLPVKRPVAPLCKFCHKPFIPIGRGQRRHYCEGCALVD